MSTTAVIEPIKDPRGPWFRRLPVISHFNKSVGLQRGRYELGADQARWFDRLETDKSDTRYTLERAGGVLAQAATELGMSRQALYRRLDRLGIRRD